MKVGADGQPRGAIDRLRDAYGARRLSLSEVVADLLERVERLNPELGAVTATDAERSLREAARANMRYRDGESPRALEGIPFVVKDLLDTEGVPTEYGSSIFASTASPRLPRSRS